MLDFLRARPRQFCLLACLFVCMWMHFAQLTDKMDPKYIIALEPSGFHNDAHAKKMDF